MGFAVVHLEKAKGTDSGMSAHIERTIDPKNADKERTHLNKELIDFPDGVENRTQAIQYRLDNAGLTRKIGTNQVRAIRVMLSGTHEDMMQIENKDQLNNWCNDNLDWLNHTFGKENVVSAVLHLDEKTPHIHATVVPVVETERKRRKREENVKKTYRKKKPTSRLCADEVMSRISLKSYQDSYAIAMAKYGLQRGIDGSKAKHISTSQYYRELQQQSESLQEDISELINQQTTAQKELSATKSDIRKENLKNSAADVGSKLLDGASSLLGTSKVKRLEAENRELKEQNEAIKEQTSQELKETKKLYESYKSQINIEYNRRLNEFKTKEQKLEREKTNLENLINKIYKMFPKVAEFLKIESLCKAIGFATDQITRLLRMERVPFSGVLSNPETRQTYRTKNSTAHISTDQTNGKMSLYIDNQPHNEWFDEQQHRRMYPSDYKRNKSKGTRL